MSMNTDQLIQILERAYTFSPDGSDFDIFVDGWDADAQVLQGSDEDGNEYEIPFDEIDLEADSFYELAKIVVDAD